MIKDPEGVVGRMVGLARMIPRYRPSDPFTSKLAALSVKEYSDTQAVKVLCWILLSEPHGKTYWEVESDLDMRSADKRMSDLKHAKLIFGTGLTRETAFGSQAEVCRVTGRVLGRVGAGEQYGMAI